MGLTLRTATREDTEAILLVRPEWTEFALSALFDAVDAAARVAYYVAESDGHVVSTIALMPKNTVVEAVDQVGYRFVCPDDEDVAWMDELNVAPGERGAGLAVATMLLGYQEAGRLGYRRAEGRTRDPLPAGLVKEYGVTDEGPVELPDGTTGHAYSRAV